MACGDCIVNQMSSVDFARRLAAADEFPVAGSLELTLGCNLWCRHCYIRYPGAADGEMSTAQACAVLDWLAGQGVLFLLLTGGEIFARPDFREIYLHAKRRGLVLTLYTNATRVDDDLAAFLADWPPRRIEITVYGHTAATFERVTGVPGSFAAFRAGLDRLLARGLPVHLKMMVMRSNQHEFEAVRRWAEAELRLPFRWDGVINPRLDGHRGVLRERLEPEAVARLQAEGGLDRPHWEKLRALAADAPAEGPLFRCGAGVRTFHVDPQGRLHPCMMWRSTPYDLLAAPSAPAWHRHLAGLRSAERPAGSACGTCAESLACGNCAAASALEAERPGQSVPYFCAIKTARERLFRFAAG